MVPKVLHKWEKHDHQIISKVEDYHSTSRREKYQPATDDANLKSADCASENEYVNKIL